MAHGGGNKTAYTVMVGLTAGKGSLERPRCRSECKNKMHLK
jgi:hypothetical protein